MLAGCRGYLPGSLANPFLTQKRGHYFALIINNELGDHADHNWLLFQRFLAATAWSPRGPETTPFLGPFWPTRTAPRRRGGAKTRVRHAATRPQEAFFAARAPDGRVSNHPNLPDNGRTSRDPGRIRPGPHVYVNTSTPATQKHIHKCPHSDVTHIHVLYFVQILYG